MTEKPKKIPINRKSADDLLYRSLRAVYHFEKSLEDRFGLGYQGIYLLQFLRQRESAIIGEIALTLGIKPFSATRLVQRLVNLGYISKERTEDDRRVVSVKLEAAGNDFVDAIEAFNYSFIGGKTSELPDKDQEAFIRVAENIDRVLGVEDRIKEEY
ncbi:MAG: winged helix-turn-helix transcriptional regulator [Spirochaetales bacterium]|nr:winged helix-turn-helix transcriptional regulator [Spirochaetales bacterium]